MANRFCHARAKPRSNPDAGIATLILDRHGAFRAARRRRAVKTYGRRSYYLEPACTEFCFRKRNGFCSATGCQTEAIAMTFEPYLRPRATELSSYWSRPQAAPCTSFPTASTPRRTPPTGSPAAKAASASGKSAAATSGPGACPNAFPFLRWPPSPKLCPAAYLRRPAFMLWARHAQPCSLRDHALKPTMRPSSLTAARVH